MPEWAFDADRDQTGRYEHRTGSSVRSVRRKVTEPAADTNSAVA
jgi:hypothetical protein